MFREIASNAEISKEKIVSRTTRERVFSPPSIASHKHEDHPHTRWDGQGHVHSRNEMARMCDTPHQQWRNSVVWSAGKLTFNPPQLSRKLRNLRERDGCLSLRRALASIW